MIYTTTNRLDSKMRGFQSSVSSGNVPHSQELTWSFDGDLFGMASFFGTLFGTTIFLNPQIRGNLVMSASSILATEDPITSITDHASSHVYANSASNNWFEFDLGIGRSIRVTKYSYRARGGFDGDFPFNLVLEGSNDHSAWTTIDTQNPISPVITARDQWRSFAPPTQSVFYRYVRLRQPGNNLSSNSMFSAGEIEIYGTLIY